MIITCFYYEILLCWPNSNSLRISAEWRWVQILHFLHSLTFWREFRIGIFCGIFCSELRIVCACLTFAKTCRIPCIQIWTKSALKMRENICFLLDPQLSFRSENYDDFIILSPAIYINSEIVGKGVFDRVNIKRKVKCICWVLAKD